MEQEFSENSNHTESMNNVGVECTMDYSGEFTNYEVFKSRESLIQWTREVGKKNGFVIVIKRSDTGDGGTRSRITFGCERSGQYRDNKKKGNENDKGKKRKITGTKKCGCPFTLKGEKLDNDDDRMLKVICGVHNHPAAKHFEGHSYAARLSNEENSVLVDMSKNMVKPKDILVTLKNRDSSNVSTLRTIYNAHQKYKVTEMAGRSQMQQLLSKLSEHNYIEFHRSCNNTDSVKDLFWASPLSIDLLHAFPHVLLMDYTYKTNRYRLPLLEIVGVTSTNMTFSVASAYLYSEREEHYVWALDKLKSLMDENAQPKVIVSDKELSLMNAIDKVFSSTRNFLCRWHISRNILAKCKSMFATTEQWEKFIISWNVLVWSSSENEFVHHLSILQRDFSAYPKAVEYVTKNWLTKYKERFVAA